MRLRRTALAARMAVASSALTTLATVAGRRFSTSSRPIVAVVSPRDNPALSSAPKHRADLLIADNLETMLGYGELLQRAGYATGLIGSASPQGDCRR